MDNQGAERLLEKYLQGNASEQEELLVQAWLMDRVASNQGEDIAVSEYPLPAELWEKVRLGIRPRRVRLWPRIAAAASILLVLGFGFYFYADRIGSDKVELSMAKDIAPGKNGATLTLANGKKILISDALAGKVADEFGVKISKTADGQLVYEITDISGAAAVGFNTLSTSKGEQTQVRLQDGTVVYLNAESSLRYPTRFAGAGKREVSLEGEGYFEVARDKLHPFMVSTSTQVVQVLGTHFNINSYKDETSVKTTLLEGSVRVSQLGAAAGRSANVVLKPDQQAVLSGKDIVVTEVEADEVASWKNGKFAFSSEALYSIMKKAERWYGVEVVFEDNVGGLKLTGSISRFDNISKLLKTLEETGDVAFTVKDKKISVRKNRK